MYPDVFDAIPGVLLAVQRRPASPELITPPVRAKLVANNVGGCHPLCRPQQVVCDMFSSRCHRNCT